MGDRESIKVKTRKDEDNDNTATFIMFLIILGVSYGIGYKISGKTEMGGLIGMGLGFVGSMFIQRFREMIIVLTMFFGGLALLALLLDWIMS